MFKSDPPARSIVTCSPGYALTLIGLSSVPVNVLVKWPRYVPPRSQIVSPAWTALHVDAETLTERAESAGWKCEVILQEKDGHYLARLAHLQAGQ